MLLPEGKMLRCPDCGGQHVLATAHVTQTWCLNHDGHFVESKTECDETTHEPDLNDVLECESCGFSSVGTAFLTDEYELVKTVALTQDGIDQLPAALKDKTLYVLKAHDGLVWVADRPRPVGANITAVRIENVCEI